MRSHVIMLARNNAIDAFAPLERFLIRFDLTQIVPPITEDIIFAEASPVSYCIYFCAHIVFFQSMHRPLIKLHQLL